MSYIPGIQQADHVGDHKPEDDKHDWEQVGKLTWRCRDCGKVHKGHDIT